MVSVTELIARARSVARNLFSRSRGEGELDASIRSYVDLLADEKIRAGMSVEEARRAALVEVGGIERVKDDVRDVRSGAWLETAGRDARYAVRTLARRPAFTAVAVIARLVLGLRRARRQPSLRA